jgi:hypothetical protein
MVAAAASAQSHADRLEWPKTDFSKRTVDLAEIRSGGPPKDGIPAIDSPRFVSVKDARAWLDPKEPVIVFVRGRDARAYPLQILTYHEIVNDEVGAQPVAVTFCPLCNASIVFDRRIDRTVLDFGTTGRLRKSDLVMYDRQTESWWQQFTGIGIVGRFAGAKLTQLPSTVSSFKDFAAAYGAGKVLSRETGHVRSYGRNPYRGYDRIDQHPFLFTDRTDPRLPPMERVLAIVAGERTRLHPFTALERTPILESELAGIPYVVFATERVASALDTDKIADGRAIPAAAAYNRRLDARTLSFVHRDGKTTDAATGSEWNLFGEAIAGPLQGKRLTPIAGGVHFAFAWLAFNPSSEVAGAAAQDPAAPKPRAREPSTR